MGATGGPVSGKGLKHTGLKTVKQIISRTENLIQAVNLGNKSKEVRNELDTLLGVLIDKKQIRPEFRSNLMEKLF
jgi:ATP phosphoribosyltransferase